MEPMTLDQVTSELKRLNENIADLRDDVRRLYLLERRDDHSIVEYSTDHPYIYTNPEMHQGEPTNGV